MRADALCQAGLPTFLSTIGGVYEKTPWIAEKAFARGPFTSLTALAAGLKAVVDEATPVRYLPLTRTQMPARYITHSFP